jgi:small subunit ribosomal protein S18
MAVSRNKKGVRRGRRKRRPRPGKCPFCQAQSEPSYKDPSVLKVYLTPRAKIAGRDKTGVCAKHQRKLAREIKKARHLALLPFVRTIE